MYDAEAFITESNKIERIIRPPTTEERAMFHYFMALKEIEVKHLEEFVNVYQPGAVLRDKPGMDVRVGSFIPPLGGNLIREDLTVFLRIIQRPSIFSPYQAHLKYEALHPFTDCNGRSGRMVWAWMMRDFPLGFLHHFYYQSLQAAGR